MNFRLISSTPLTCHQNPTWQSAQLRANELQLHAEIWFVMALSGSGVKDKACSCGATLECYLRNTWLIGNVFTAAPTEMWPMASSSLALKRLFWLHRLSPVYSVDSTDPLCAFSLTPDIILSLIEVTAIQSEGQRPTETPQGHYSLCLSCQVSDCDGQCQH